MAVMDRYPVKPGTPVHIPARPEPTERKPIRLRKEKTPEEQLASLRRVIQWLVILVVSLAVSLAISVGALVYTIMGIQEAQPQELPVSRNYTTSASTDNP